MRVAPPARSCADRGGYRTDGHSDLGRLPTEKELGHSTDPAECGGLQMQQWMETCDRTHDVCSKRRKHLAADERFVPTRLLDLGTEPGGTVRVVETAGKTMESPYMSLSHCWGLVQFRTLTPETYPAFTSTGVPWEVLSRNFREAIELAWFLRVRYMWIDSLCIVQGTNDFHNEAPLMHKVYRNSYCNIAIADSYDSTGGLYRRRTAADMVPATHKADGKSPILGRKTWRLIPRDLWDAQLLDTVLYRRGWVFQGK